MTSNKHILFAEDDVEDRYLFKKACEKNGINSVGFVENGEELIKYISSRDKLAPSLILLDLNMPKMSGLEALKLIKNDAQLKHIPIVIFSTSNDKEDIRYSYNLGASSYIVKPDDFRNLVDIVRELKEYWLETVELP